MRNTPVTNVPQATPVPASPLSSIDALRAREFTLQASVNSLTAQRAVLAQGARIGSPEIRATSEAQLLRLDLNLASSKAELATVQAELAARKAEHTLPQTYTEVPSAPPHGLLDRISPDAITAAFVMTVLAVLLPLSIGLSRRLWRRAPAAPPPIDDKIAPRLDRLEQAVDAIAIEVERVSESQRFVAKVLTDRPAAAPASVAEPLDAASLGEGKPFLALGAGPMEPIRVAEKQGVKQSVTPH